MHTLFFKSIAGSLAALALGVSVATTPASAHGGGGGGAFHGGFGGGGFHGGFGGGGFRGGFGDRGFRAGFRLCTCRRLACERSSQRGFESWASRSGRQREAVIAPFTLKSRKVL
jgi:hypothetical protein